MYFLDASIGKDFFSTISDYCNSRCKRWSSTILCAGLLYSIMLSQAVLLPSHNPLLAFLMTSLSSGSRLRRGLRSSVPGILGRILWSELGLPWPNMDRNIVTQTKIIFTVSAYFYLIPSTVSFHHICNFLKWEIIILSRCSNTVCLWSMALTWNKYKEMSSFDACNEGEGWMESPPLFICRLFAYIDDTFYIITLRKFIQLAFQFIL